MAPVRPLQRFLLNIGLVIDRHCDVRDEKQVEETVAYAIEKCGSLDIKYSNAGVAGPVGSILDLDMVRFDRTIAINLSGSLMAVKHEARVMVANKIRGSIICATSTTSTIGGRGPHAYTISKHGLLGLVRSAASELGKHGIRVNCVSPFGVATPILAGTINGVEGVVCKVANLKGIVFKAKHVAEAVLFLASDESAYISGHDLVVDGGFTVVTDVMPVIEGHV